MRYHQAVHDVPTLFESCERPTVGEKYDSTLSGLLPKKAVRSELDIPDLPERDVIKHFVNLSQMNFGVDNGMYPLGSCTMKYNPKFCDDLVSWPTVS
ncbi:MAG TPA: aminomethyl-transferring glycine dehydrogenase subunit GcvPB, partial [Thermoplasmata archaeon]|nr:aminomethyl-transferring glycine dehydrogenase subunit GcvPB [Thermoplasmata archaeon]